jgi:hypothetical protein
MCNPVPRYHHVFFFWHHQWCVVILSASTIFCKEIAVNTSSLIPLAGGPGLLLQQCAKTRFHDNDGMNTKITCIISFLSVVLDFVFSKISYISLLVISSSL